MSQSNWTLEEEKKILKLSDNGHSIKSCLSYLPNRTYSAIASKRARLRKTKHLWGKTHDQIKRKLLKYWLTKFKPKYVIEAFAGTGDTTELYAQNVERVIANEYCTRFYNIATDKLKKYNNVELHNTPADSLLHSLCRSKYNNNYDWIDLDPFGTVSSLVPLAFEALKSGYICCTITDLHSLRFGHSNPFSWRCLFPDNISNMKIINQLGYILGWIIFDCSRRIYPRGHDMYRIAKILKPIQVTFLGPSYLRLVRALFEVKEVKSFRRVKYFVQNELKLFKHKSKLPYVDPKPFLKNINLD